MCKILQIFFLLSIFSTTSVFAMIHEDLFDPESLHVNSHRGKVLPSVLSREEEEAFQLSSEIVTDLEQVPQVFVHFFWATGHSPAMIAEERSHLSVPIGGKEYDSQFFDAVTGFLNFSPPKVRVVMTCDRWTYESNLLRFQEMEGAFKERFSITFVEDVSLKLMDIHPTHQQTIDIIFRNASSGNPVISSDVYRLLLRSVQRGAPINSIVAYLDVDLFTTTLRDKETDRGNFTLFLKNLFSPDRIGHARGQNDFIKVKVTPEGEAHDREVLERLTSSLAGTSRTIIPHFPILIEFLRLSRDAETEEERDLIWEDYLTYVRSTHFEVKEVIDQTGPGFLLSGGFSGIPPKLMPYKQVYSASWFRPEFHLPKPSDIIGLRPNVIVIEEAKTLARSPLVISRLSLNSTTDLSPKRLITEKRILDLKSIIDCSSEEEDALLRDMLTELNREERGEKLNDIELKINEEYEFFRSLFSDMGFLKKFGEEDPFYKRFRLFLENTCLSRSPHVRALIRLYYQYDQLYPKMRKYSKQEWAEMLHSQLSHRGLDEAFFNAFNKMFNVDFELSVSTIEDIIRDIDPLRVVSVFDL